MCKMANENQTVDQDIGDKLMSLKDKISRTTNFLQELRTLSKSCQEIPPSSLAFTSDRVISENYDGTSEEEELLRERQIFIRRVVQLRAELEDGRDLVISLCKSHLPAPQWRLIAQDLQEHDSDPEESGDDEDDDDEDDDYGGDDKNESRHDHDRCSGNRRQSQANSRMGFGSIWNSFDFDPSVRFFGIDWEKIFGRCFSLSLNARIFCDQIMEAYKNISSGAKRPEFDLVLINRILRDLAALEMDVSAHAEAVLQGRLSKSQRRLIFKEQFKHCSAQLSKVAVASKASSSVNKSKSFRDTSQTSRQISKYKKNKTTNLEKLSCYAPPNQKTRSVSDHSLEEITVLEQSDEDPRRFLLDQRKSLGCSTTAMLVTSSSVNGNLSSVITTTAAAAMDLQRKKKSSFIHNFSSILKNIR